MSIRSEELSLYSRELGNDFAVLMRDSKALRKKCHALRALSAALRIHHLRLMAETAKYSRAKAQALNGLA